MENLQNKVKEAVRLFIDKDKALLELKVYEPAVAHRIAVYLEHIFGQDESFRGLNLNFDCEYDKCEDRRKEDPDGKPMRPDILVHRRNQQEGNLIVMEIKKTRKSSWDEKKLKALTNATGYFKYELGVFVYFPKGEPKYIWFAKGQRLAGANTTISTAGSC